MTKQREAFEKWAKAQNVQLTLDIAGVEYFYGVEKVAWASWQAAQADKLEYAKELARKVAELVQVAENNLASFYSNQRACIEGIPPNYTIDEIIKVFDNSMEQEQ